MIRMVVLMIRDNCYKDNWLVFTIKLATSNIWLNTRDYLGITE